MFHAIGIWHEINQVTEPVHRTHLVASKDKHSLLATYILTGARVYSKQWCPMFNEYWKSSIIDKCLFHYLQGAVYRYKQAFNEDMYTCQQYCLRKQTKAAKYSIIHTYGSTTITGNKDMSAVLDKFLTDKNKLSQLCSTKCKCVHCPLGQTFLKSTNSQNSNAKYNEQKWMLSPDQK